MKKIVNYSFLYIILLNSYLKNAVVILKSINLLKLALYLFYS